jgi:hypothetical protein
VSTLGQQAVQNAENEIGKPYVYGATGPSSFDCSGLTQSAWKAAGVAIPRTSEEQAAFGSAVAQGQQQPGDLITSNWGDGPSSHVSMFAGNGQVVEASHTGTNVRMLPYDSDYVAHTDTIRRMPGAGGASAGGSAGSSTTTGGVETAGFLSNVLSLPESIGNFFGALMWLANPMNWVRITLFIVGVALVLFGIHFLAKEARQL